MADESLSAARPAAFETIFYGGMAIGVLDFIDASIFFPLYYGITFQQVWWGPASGLIGREAARGGGWNTALLGLALHFAVAFCIATVYYISIRFLPFMLRHPIVSGLIFGVIANFVMQHVVIPLSAIGPRPNAEPVGSLINSVVGHALLVGLPVALIARWSATHVKKLKQS